MQPNLALIPPAGAEGPTSSDPVDFHLKLDCDTVDEFTERYANDISRGGIFIRTRKPLPVGTKLKLDLRIWNGEPLIVGEGTVFWTREPDMTAGDSGVLYPGMGVRFGKLTRASQDLINHTLAERNKRKRTDSREIPGVPMPSDGGGGSSELLSSGIPEEVTPAVPMGPDAQAHAGPPSGTPKGADRHATPVAMPVQPSASMRASAPAPASTKASASGPIKAAATSASGPIKATATSASGPIKTAATASGQPKGAAVSLPEPNVKPNVTTRPRLPKVAPTAAASPAAAASMAAPLTLNNPARKKRFMMAGAGGLLVLAVGVVMVTTSGSKTTATGGKATSAPINQITGGGTARTVSTPAPARSASASATGSPQPRPAATADPPAAAAPAAGHESPPVVVADSNADDSPSAADQDSPAERQKGKTRAAPSRRDTRSRPPERHAAPTVVAMAATGGHRPTGASPTESPVEERPIAPPPAATAVAPPPPVAHVAASPKEELRAPPPVGAPALAHKLRLTSIPSEADVLLDGRPIGKTPLFGVEIDVNRPHALVIRKDGYAAFQQAITAGSDWTVKSTDRSVSTLKISALLKQQ